MKRIKVSDDERKAIQQCELKILAEIDRICRENEIQYTIAYGSLIGAVRHGGFIPWDDDLDICMTRQNYVRFKEICLRDLDSCFFYQSHDTDSEYYYLFDKIRLNNTIFRESYISEYNINHGIYVDIFPIDNISDNRFLRSVQFWQYQICRAGLHAKYLHLGARHGKKKFVFALLRIVFILFTKDYLYNKALNVAQKYNDIKTKDVASFVSRYRRKDIFSSDMYSDLIPYRFENMEVWIPQKYDEYLSSIYGDYMCLPPEEKRTTVHDLTELIL